MAELQTVRIRHAGFEHGLLINRDEYDPEKHELFAGSGPAPDPVAEPQTGTVEEAKTYSDSRTAPEADLLKMSKPDLIQWAKVRNLDLGDVTANHRKDEILSAIQAALKPVDPS